MRKHSIKNINRYIVWCLLDYYFLLDMDRPGVLFKGRNVQFGLFYSCYLKRQ